MADVIRSRRPTRAKKDKNENGVASAAEIPLPAPPRRPTGISINEPSVGRPSKVAKTADPNEKGKKSTGTYPKYRAPSS